MTLIIKHLSIKNFKTFESIELSVESEYLVVLDGPNGFGKTSFFDALELLLTGTIQRYVELEDIVVDGRSRKHGCPWLFNQVKCGAWLSIRAEVVINKQTKFLERAVCETVLKQQKGLKNLQIPLYELTALDAKRDSAVADESGYFSKWFGLEYQREFGLFHYVEQEENTRLLKRKEKDRQQQIAHLFEIGEVQKKTDKIKLVESTIGKLCSPQKKQEVGRLKATWEEAKAQILPEGKANNYERLIEISDQPWDRETIECQLEQLEQWLSVDGELFRLNRFIENFSHYENQLYNQELIKKLLPQENLQRRMLMFAHRVSKQQAWQQEIRQYDTAKQIISAFKDVIKALKNDQLTLPKELAELLPDIIKQSEFEHKVTELKILITSANKLDESRANLVSIRAEMVEVFKQFLLTDSPTEICPTCGYIWESADALLKGIDKQGEVLKLFSEQQNSQLINQLANFKNIYQDPIERSLTAFLGQQQDKIAYKRQLVELNQDQVLWLEGYTKSLTDAGIEYQNLLLKNYDLDAELPLTGLELLVRSKFKAVDDSLLHPYFDRLYKEIFQKESAVVKKVTLSQIADKIKYLRQQQSIASSIYVTTCEQRFLKANQQFERASKLKSHLSKLKGIYESEKKLYLESIVKEIEILFHIYSGRLMQSYQQGLGIFIENDGNSIAFHEKPEQSYDVVFSMSSGQLSALVLSFTLALNQRYAKHNLLLIDDPVQTLDEINVAGFVELLRTEFSDRQVIISTHEDNMSAYFRYKYKKFGLPVARINFMEQARVMLA